MLKAALVLIFVSTSLLAQQAPPPPVVASPVPTPALPVEPQVKPPAPVAADPTTAENRAASSWSIYGNYSAFETWMMSKYGITVGYIASKSNVFELEFMKGSLGFGAWGFDFAEIKEQRLSLLWRNYGKRNSFSFVQGLYYNKLEFHIGDEMLASFSGDQRAYLELMELSTIGFTFGVGNRWQLKNGMMVGADWFSLHVPVWIVSQNKHFIDYTPHENDRRNISNTWDVLRKVPEVAVLKLQFGINF